MSTGTIEIPHVEKGTFVLIGRRDDTDKAILLETNIFVERNATQISDYCRLTLLEIGRNNSLTFDFLSLFYLPEQGGVQKVLEFSDLRDYIISKYPGLGE